MEKVRKSQKKSPDTRSQEISDLLRQALQQPGVNELMAVYENWRTLDNAARLHRQAMGVRRIVSVSNTSGPVVRRIT